MEGQQHPERRDLAHTLSRIDPQGGQGHVERPAYLSFRLGLGSRWFEDTAPEQGAPQQHEPECKAPSAHGFPPASASAVRCFMTSAVKRSIDDDASASLMLPNIIRQAR